MIDLEKLGITEKKLIESGFSVGTAYNIMKGKISKKSLLKLYDLGFIEKVENTDKFICKNNSLFGEYEAVIKKKELILSKDNYKIRLFLRINDIDIIYNLDNTDILELMKKDINILERNKLIIKVIGKKIQFIR